MSKIFRISGNFQQDNKWMEPDPAFTGEIVTIDPFDPIFEYPIWADAPEVKSLKDVLQGGRPTYRENELFCGYCDGVYDTRSEEKECRRRYVIGVFLPNGDIALEQLSNDADWPPVRIDISSSFNRTDWCEVSYLFETFPARLKLEEQTYTSEGAERIKKVFRELDTEWDCENRKYRVNLMRMSCFA